MIKIACTFVLMFSSSVAHAWNPFGPSNYEECVVEKMKGQDRAMINRVHDACELRFPHERELGLMTEPDFRWTWGMQPDGKVSFRIITNETKYDITRAQLLLFESNCGSSTQFLESPAIADFRTPRVGSISVSPVSKAGDFRCAQTRFWGKRRK
jgi:hypothetical protein